MPARTRALRPPSEEQAVASAAASAFRDVAVFPSLAVREAIIAMYDRLLVRRRPPCRIDLASLMVVLSRVSGALMRSRRTLQAQFRAYLLLVLSPPSFAVAQVTQDSVRALPGITITATRAGASVLKAPIAVSKIETADLRAVNGYGIEDALARVPGVIAQSRYGTSDVRLVIRGFGARGAGDRSNSGTSRGVRVLLDGFPETEPDGRTALDQLD